ncbi:hypothetical protein QNI19_38190 [Cytophagaceae bacterium DM2B3-1]|uniref:TonB C-terminal domain-containing protein n=1 Tax=Xanthocytophaga flava TaxID=3048013 RepID=A0ABT7CYJ5_9BACT|nr:hypothetical protein [Xanthocytophaga flavus]MDJ1498823.1 hypothetical protein [Xanthocytophaga flavus]
MKRSLVLALFFTTSFLLRGWSQTSDPILTVANGSFETYFEKRFRWATELNQTDKECLYPVIATFVKFRVDSTGVISDFSVSPNTPIPLEEKFTKFFKEAGKVWKPALKNGKPVTSSTYVLPCIFYKVGCSSEQMRAENVKIMLNDLFTYLSTNKEKVKILRLSTTLVYPPKS